MRTSLILATAVLAAICALPARAAGGGASIVYDFIDHYADARITGAMTSSATSSTSGGVEMRSIFLHPGAGDATATYDVQLPSVGSGERLFLVFSAGMRDGFVTNDPDHPSDGVLFTARIDGQEVFRRDLAGAGWADGSADLTGRAGRPVSIAFATNRKSNSNYDWSSWGEPMIIKVSGSALGGIGKSAACAGIVTARASGGDASIEITPLAASGASAGATRAIELAQDVYTAIRFDYRAVKAASVRVGGSKAENVAVHGFAPQLQVTACGPSSALVLAGKAVELRCVIRNTGKAIVPASSGVKAILSMAAANASVPGKTASAVRLAAKPLGTLYPGDERVLVWKTNLPNSPAFASWVSVAGTGISAKSDTQTWAISAPPRASVAAAKKAEGKQLSDGTVVLQNQSVRMRFLRNGLGFTGWVLSVPKGNTWQQVATGPMGKVVTAGKSTETATYSLHPTQPKVAVSGGKPAVTFTETRKIDGASCRFSWTFVLDPSTSRISATQSMAADQPVDVTHFSGPTVYAGDGSFGSKKDEALFPGLEYLLSESSSGTENASAPYNLRTVPHPNKITVPFMAVRNGSTLVSLEWDPLQKWDGSSDRPAAVFASPNFLDGQSNHKVGLFAPSIPDWGTENKLIADKPYRLAAGKKIVLNADIIARSDSKTVLDAVDGWLSRHGVPEVPETGKSIADVAALCEEAYLKSAWDPNAKGWKHTNTSPPEFDPLIAAYMLRKANYVMNKAKSQALRDVANAAIDKVGKSNIPVEVALLAGGLRPALKRAAARANSLISSQKPNGSWPFTPDEKHKVFGTPGDTSSGLTAGNAATLLEYALVTCDTKAKSAGLRAIKYLDTQLRPEGAQTWELQLHVPDILASARLVTAYTYAYRLTGDDKYMKRAVYWGKSGLPFVYLWNASDRPIMRYGTIPVFGVTWFNGQPWFGVCVQWCGLEYAYSVAKLAGFDNSLPWKRIADGILNCAVQQQDLVTRKYPADAGMYPDAYSPVKGDEEYHWDLNPRLISRNLMRSAESDMMPTSYIIADAYRNMLTATLPAQIGQFVHTPDFMRGAFGYAPGNTLYAIIGGVRDPLSVTINSLGKQRVADVEDVEEGWQYDPKSLTTILKFKTQRENSIAVDLLDHEKYFFDRQGLPKPQPAPTRK